MIFFIYSVTFLHAFHTLSTILLGLKNQAWVTSAVTDEEARKSIVLASSLKRVLSNRSVVILASTKVTPALRYLL